MRKPAFRLLIGDKELRAIGHVAAQWAYLEEQVDHYLAVFLKMPSATPLTQRPTPRSFADRIKLFRECVTLALSSDPAWASSFLQAIDDIASLKGKRDEIIHGQWRLRRTRGAGRLTTGFDHVRRQPAVKAKSVIMSADQIEATACRISEAHVRLLWLLAELFNPPRFGAECETACDKDAT